ncbi:MAG: PLP-dependent aminotransferase family protein, partial [Enterococcus faecalis]|nr:PLP-dependent aminotransferase family protein [Enterococcus faecalis]
MPINSYENYALSWRPVKERLTRPYYQSLVQQLEADILSGALQKNVKLPSQRE